MITRRLPHKKLYCCPPPNLELDSLMGTWVAASAADWCAHCGVLCHFLWVPSTKRARAMHPLGACHPRGVSDTKTIVGWTQIQKHACNVELVACWGVACARHGQLPKTDQRATKKQADLKSVRVNPPGIVVRESSSDALPTHFPYRAHFPRCVFPNVVLVGIFRPCMQTLGWEVPCGALRL